MFIPSLVLHVPSYLCRLTEVEKTKGMAGFARYWTLTWGVWVQVAIIGWWLYPCHDPGLLHGHFN